MGLRTRLKMDLNCKYTRMEGEIKNVYCKSPLTEETFECNCSNYKICSFYFKSEDKSLNQKGNLEKKAFNNSE